MKSSLIILALCAFIALVHSTPVPQEAEAPNRPIMNAFSTANQFIGDIAKRVAQTTGNFIDNTAQSMTSGINTVAHTLSDGITRPFVSAEANTNE